MFKNSPFFLSRQESALLAVTLFWGTTFLIIHIAMRQSGPLFFVGMRFLIAALISTALFGRGLAKISRTELIAGSVIGVFIAVGFSLQSAGLQAMSSSQSAFISALYVPMVPVIQWAVYRKPPHLLNWLGIVLAFIGLLLVTDISDSDFSFTKGQILTIGGAVAIACEIVLISFFSNRVDSRNVTVVQLYTVALLTFLAMPIFGEPVPAFSPIWLSAALCLGLMSSVIQITMNWAQKSISPARATIIYTLEPIWAGLIGRLIGEQFAPHALLGVILIVAAITISEIRTPRLHRKKI